MSHAAVIESPETKSTSSSGGRLVAPDGRTLPLRGATLSAEACGGIARVVLTQRFVNVHDEPLRVSYLLPLPSDGAVAGFSFRVDGRRIVGEVDRREAARERFEQALVEGRTAALLEEERSSLFTQEVGNIPPRAEVEVEIEIDQRLRWMPEGAWEWRFPTVVGARYMGAQGRVEDAERVTVDVAERGLPARMGLALRIDDTLALVRRTGSSIRAGRREATAACATSGTSDLSPERSGALVLSARASGTEFRAGALGPIESPSHRLVVDRGARSRVTFEDGAALDRDVVVRWPVAASQIGVSLALSRPAAAAHQGRAYGLLTLVPPNAPARSVPRDLVFLVDVSGSMHGEPLEQLKRVAAAMIDTLTGDDRVELIAFGSTAVRFSKEPIAATRDGKKAALAWLRGLRASGGTEMVKAVIEALRPLRAGSQRQVVLMTDGYIGFERELVREVRERLPEGARLHTVGVGSAVNRTLTQWAARAGNGVELVVGLGEDPERVAARLLARTSAPIVTDVILEGDALLESAPARVPDLYAGAPSLVSLALAPRGGTLTVRGRMAEGDFVHDVNVPAATLGTGLASIATLFGRERVEDLETEIAAAGVDAHLDAAIEQVGIAFQIATRMTSWVAISEEVSVDPDARGRSVRVPHEVPHGVSIEGMGLRAPTSMAFAGPMAGAAMSLTRAGAASYASLASPPYPPGNVPALFEASSSLATGAHAALPQKRRASRAWIWILIAALLVALAAVGAWLALSSGGAEPAPSEPAGVSEAEEHPARE